MRELGETLLAITAGEGKENCRPETGAPKSSRSLGVAYCYHRARVERPGAADAVALHEVRTIVDSTLSDGTIRKYAQKHRDQVLRMLEGGETPVDIDPQIEAHVRARGDKVLNAKLDVAALTRELARYIANEGAPGIAEYREYLRKKSPRPDVE